MKHIRRCPQEGFIYVIAKWRKDVLAVHYKKDSFAIKGTFGADDGAVYLYNKKELLETKIKKGEFVIKTTSKAAKQLYELIYKRGFNPVYYIKAKTNDPLYKIALKNSKNKYSKHIS